VISFGSVLVICVKVRNAISLIRMEAIAPQLACAYSALPGGGTVCSLASTPFTMRPSDHELAASRLKDSMVNGIFIFAKDSIQIRVYVLS
jgi:hypothetical protein